MIDDLAKMVEMDARLAVLLDDAREYAQIYLLARQRQTGCEGMGELVALREEFREAVEKLAQYCLEKGYSLDLGIDDIDGAAHKLFSNAFRR